MTSWLAQEVRGGPVLYIAGEGSRGLGIRVQAWRHAYHEDDRIDGFHAVDAPVNLMRDDEAEVVAEWAAKHQPSLVVFDTLAQCAAGGDENSVRDMGIVLNNARRIIRAGRCSVLLVHHSRKDGTVVRGSSALPAAVETSIEATAEGSIVTLSSRKTKDSEPFRPVVLMADKVDRSVVLRGLSVHEHAVDALLHEPPSTRRVHEYLWTHHVDVAASKAELMEALTLARSAVSRATNALLRHGFVENTGSEKAPYWRALKPPPTP